MDNLTQIMKMNRTKLKLSDLNPHLMCILCGGYFIDATTIVECLHSFCRSCIVKHLESSKYCPICEVQVHKTKPLVNIRPDKTLQDIVYKLVPGLYASEMRNRRKFYRERPHYVKPNDSESVGEVSDATKKYINEENITLSLSYHTSSLKSGSIEDGFQEITTPVNNDKRYLKCPSGVTIYHLKKLIKAKYELSDNNYKVEILYKDQPLHEEFSLLDIAYGYCIYVWKRKGMLELTFRILESVIKRQKMDKIEVKLEEDNQESKESEVEGIKTEQTRFQLKVEPEPEPEPLPATVPSVIQPENEPIAPTPEVVSPPVSISQPVVLSNSVPEVRTEPVKQLLENASDDPKTNRSENVKENGVNASKEVLLQISESGVMSVSEVKNDELVRTLEESVPKNVSKQTNAGVSQTKETKNNSDVDNQEKINRIISVQPQKLPQKTNKPYKTIRCSPKTWHPVITKEKLRPTLIKNSDEPKKPMKFFKMRNMPRFLGNPSSGVKPMYAESTEKEPVPKQEEKKPPPVDHTKNLKKILKIDPKTLRPIEKDEIPMVQTPNTPILTNPFIPNNNHFLFSDPQFLPPNSGNFSGSKSEVQSNEKPCGSSKSPLHNGSYPPIRYPTHDYVSNFYPYPSNFPKLSNLYPRNDKFNPMPRPRFPPFGNLTGFNIAGYHASLPPSISMLFNPPHHLKKLSPVNEKKGSKDESTKETNKNCDDNNLKLNKSNQSYSSSKDKIKSKDKDKEREREKEKEREREKEKEREREKLREKAREQEKEREREKEKLKEKEKQKEQEQSKKVTDVKKDPVPVTLSNCIDKIIEDKKKETEQKVENVSNKDDNNQMKKSTEADTANLSDQKVANIETSEAHKDHKMDDNKLNCKNDLKDQNGQKENADNLNAILVNNDKVKDKDDHNKVTSANNCNKAIDDNSSKSNESACNYETKTEIVNNDNKPVNDKER